MTEPVKRRYRSTERAAAAAATRARIRPAAAQLFVEQGYLATTMRGVAALADVDERTLYDAFPSKTALFAHTLGWPSSVTRKRSPLPTARKSA